MLDMIHKHGVLLDQFGIFKVFQLEQGVCYGLLRHGGIQPMQSGGKFLLVERTVKIPFHIGAVEIGISKILVQQLENGIFIVRFSIIPCHLIPLLHFIISFFNLIRSA